MFNFIFEGKIGDILAPVVPTNKLFLAIQHHRNNEIQPMWDSTMSNPNVLSDGTQSPIHVACRYNNRYAVEFALSRGTNIQLPDQTGNVPLHYAAKYGNLDMCRFLIEKGSKTHLRNKQNQTAYDVAENHLVRQYLLPLVLTGEREAAEASGVPIPGTEYGFGVGAAPYTTYLSAPPPPPLIGGVYSAPPPTAFPPPPTHTHTAQAFVPQAPGTPGSTFQHIPLTPGASDAPPTVAPAVAPTAPRVENRSIQPDGFHSSASDPVLQQKYGHIIEVKNIAPPPTGAVGAGGPPPPPVSYYSSAPSGIYSRYVAYDATTNSAVPNTHGYPPAAAPSAYPAPAPYGASAVYTPAAPVAPAPVPAPMPYGGAPSYYAAPTVGSAPVPPPMPSGVYAPPSSSVAAPPTSTIASSSSAAPVPVTASRLTANKGDLVQQASNTLAVDVPIPTFVPPVLQTTPKHKSSDSMHSIDLLSPDGEIIDASASSSSIL